MKKVPDEIDLHGMTVDEALPQVDAFLRRAHKDGLLRVWVIHGKGSGALRSAVRDYLRSHPMVRRWCIADGERGGEGATQVDIID